MQAWEAVLREAISSDEDEREFALFQIGLVLQRHNRTTTIESDVHEETLSRELMRLALSPQRQQDTVEYLTTLVRNHPKHADGYLFVLSNAQPAILAEPLFILVAEAGAKFNKKAQYHAVVALESVLRHADDTVQSALNNHDVTDILSAWEESSDDLLASRTSRVLDMIEDIIADDLSEQ